MTPRALFRSFAAGAASVVVAAVVMQLADGRRHNHGRAVDAGLPSTVGRDAA